MSIEDKDYLSAKLLELLGATEATQRELARFAGVKQGHVNDHIRKKSFPKVGLLLKYAEFFSMKLGRRIDLYELTGIEKLRGITEMPELSDEDRILLSWYKSLPEGDTMRDILKQKIEQMKRENQEGESNGH